MHSVDLGPVSAYAVAKANGYTGTETQWVQAQAGAAQNAQLAQQAAEQAAQSAAAAAASAETAATSAAAAVPSAQSGGGGSGGEETTITTTVEERVETKYIGHGSSVSGGTELEEGGYIDTSGAFQASDGWRSSGYIAAGDALSITLALYGFTAVCACAFYAGDKTFISGVSGTDWTELTGAQTIPAGTKYYRLCIRNVDTTGYIVCTDTITTTVTAPASQKIMVGDIADGSAGYFDSSGAVQASASWVATAPIRCGDVESLSVSALAFPSVPYAVFFDRYGVCIGSLSAAENGAIATEINIPRGADTVRLNFYVEDSTQFYQIARDARKAAAIEVMHAADPLYGGKLGCVGDSITIGTYSTPRMTYAYQIAYAHNMQIDNQAIWGSVFPPDKVDGTGATRGSIYSQLEAVSEDCYAIIISGGINDADYFDDNSYWGSVSDGYDATLDTSTFCGAFEAALKYALNKWAGKPILFVFEHRMTQVYQSSYGAHFENTQFPLMVQMLQKWGVPFVNLFHDVPSIKFMPGGIARYSWDAQGIHPNVAGYRRLYVPQVESALLKIAK